MDRTRFSLTGFERDSFVRHYATLSRPEVETVARQKGSQRVAAALAALMFTGCAQGDYAALFSAEEKAPSIDEGDIVGLNTLGPTLVDQGVNFSVYSENAERIELLLFLDPESERPDFRYPMKRMGNVWNLYVEGVGRGTHYGYVAWGPNWTYSEDWYPGSIEGFKADVIDGGHRYNPNKLLLDPYAKVIHREHDWARASLGTGPDRALSTWGAGAKNVVWKTEYEWSDAEWDWVSGRLKGEAPYHDWNEVVLYEVHPKGFTADPASGVLHPGTYRGVGEGAAYLADLGITAIELLPIHEKPLDGGYWGYNNLSFFAPELSYSADYAATGDPLMIIDEFKWMVDQLHQHGIEVVVDVVYNHTGEGGLWRERIYDDVEFASSEGFYSLDPQEVASLYSYRGLDNAAYYKLNDGGRTYWNNTGVGNQVRNNHTPGRRLTLDSITWMIEELHVDGFRFDLAPVLGEIDGVDNQFDATSTILQEIVDLPAVVNNRTRIIAEPWSICPYPCGFPLGQFPKSTVSDEQGWGEWNGWYRDWWRSFVNEDGWTLSTMNGEASGGETLTGSYNLFGDDERRPYHSVNFITVHDGFTLYDLVTYEEKLNGCSPLNPVCCDDPTSPWCQQDEGETHNRSRNWGHDNGGGAGGEAMKRQMIRNFFAAMMVSHGTPLILGGDEYMRTQLGNNNAYSTGADNPFNWLEWGKYVASPDRVRMHDFVRKLIKIRMDNLKLLAPKTYRAGDIISWRGASGDPNWNSRHIQIHYTDPDGSGDELVVLINMERYPVTFQLPGGNWERLLDTQRWFDFDNQEADDDYFDQSGADVWTSQNAWLDQPENVGSSYQAADSSIVILRPGE